MRAKIILKLDETCLSAKHRVVEVAKKKTGAGITRNTCTLVSSGKIRILEIYVVALKCDAAVSAVLRQRKGERQS